MADLSRVSAQPDQQLISQLEEAVGSARRTLDETKQHHKARMAALRAEQRQEIEGIQAQVRGYEKALKAVTRSNGQRESQEDKRLQIRA
jgi:hypothetical protein